MDVSVGLAGGHVSRDPLQEKTVLVQLTVAHVIQLATVVKTRPSTSPEAEDAYIHDNRRKNGEYVRHNQLLRVACHVQYRELQQIDVIIGRGVDGQGIDRGDNILSGISYLLLLIVKVLLRISSTLVHWQQDGPSEQENG